MTEEELLEAFKDYAVKDMTGALSLVTGLFIGMYEVYCELNGGESSRAIRIKGPNGERSITIHPSEHSVH